MFENLQSPYIHRQPQQQPAIQQTSTPITTQMPQLNDQLIGQLRALKSQIQALQTSPNQQAMWQTLLTQNPQVSQLVDKMNAAYSGDPIAMFYAEARSHGLNDEQIASLVGQMRQAMS